ncbi:MAG: nucleoside triphosphate pyrophosphohydrolase [Halioglobus sp.]|nr:nucleoside triphosphate pyrophosphohydrolase [Halioglobus sp.]
MQSARYTLADLLRVMQRLRDPVSGCPWDLDQDFASIVPSTLEECYELVEAIEARDFDHVAEELGDVLFQVVFYSQLGSERELFDFDSVVDTLVEKLLRRHPHVFADGAIEGFVEEASTFGEVRESWEAIKQRERRGRSQTGLLADVPLALPALSRSQKLQKRAAQVHFDWPDAVSVLGKLEEELQELHAAMTKGGAAVKEELGDVLFTCVNLARHMEVDAESSLRDACGKFEKRIGRMEHRARGEGRTLADLDAAERDQYWERAKSEDSESDL